MYCPKASVTALSPVATDAIVAQDYDSLSDGDVAPAYFTYTLVDPDALGEKRWTTTWGILAVLDVNERGYGAGTKIGLLGCGRIRR